jgi:DNA invertase Pin-like site-specific DNA recombinase
MLNVLGGLAEFERGLIWARTAEGRERPKARGIKAWPETKADSPSTARSKAAARPGRADL